MNKMTKVFYGIVGFGVAGFYLLNSAICVSRMKYGYRAFTAGEWATSSILTLLVAIILTWWTFIILMKK
ncbi:hypothetical protein HOM50_03410 [bacterium]|jgi:hypothetical protein|nr:hypothetical protein [bacterium]MBT5015425.1 hypothetical protein [bacterium]